MLFISFYFLVWSSLTQRILHTIFCFTYSRICRENLPQEFAVAICRENLPQQFAVGICRGYLPFVFVRKSFYLYVSKPCLYESKAFLYMSKTFLFVRFSLLTVFLFVIAVAVMGHRRKHSILCLHFKQFQHIYSYNDYVYSKENVVDNVHQF